MLTTILLIITACSLFLVCTLFLQLIRYKEEISLKAKSIEYLENINLELQQILSQESPKDEIAGNKKMIRVA